MLRGEQLLLSLPSKVELLPGQAVDVTVTFLSNGVGVPKAEIFLTVEDDETGTTRAYTGTTNANGVAIIKVPGSPVPVSGNKPVSAVLQATTTSSTGVTVVSRPAPGQGSRLIWRPPGATAATAAGSAGRPTASAAGAVAPPKAASQTNIEAASQYQLLVSVPNGGRVASVQPVEVQVLFLYRGVGMPAAPVTLTLTASQSAENYKGTTDNAGLATIVVPGSSSRLVAGRPLTAKVGATALGRNGEVVVGQTVAGSPASITWLPAAASPPPPRTARPPPPRPLPQPTAAVLASTAESTSSGGPDASAIDAAPEGAEISRDVEGSMSSTAMAEDSVAVIAGEPTDQGCALGCVVCSVGPDSECVSCRAPKFINFSGTCGCNAGFGGPNCDVCEIGTYSAGGVSLPDCTACKEGYETREVGSAAASACEACYEYGTFDGVNNERCDSLAARYNITVADLEALNPLLNCSSVLLRGSMCVSATCPPGFGGPASPNCAPCPIGTYSTGGVNAKYSMGAPCSPCPIGFSTLDSQAIEASECIDCADGYYCASCVELGNRRR
eukprot:gene4808-5056_t